MILSTLILAPIVFALLILALPKNIVRSAALVMGLAHFIMSLGLFKFFNPESAAVQLSERSDWIPSLGITYFVGIDGISFWLVLLTTFLTPMVVLASWTAISDKIKGFHACLFLLTSAMLGAFLALDGILFYIFFESSLIPIYFIIGIWGVQ